MDADLLDFDGEQQSVLHRNEVIGTLGSVGIVDGDTLLSEALSLGVDYSHGGQFAHLVECAERFLLQFLWRSCELHVIFFSEGLSLWRGDPTMLLGRRVLSLHLDQKCRPRVHTHFVDGPPEQVHNLFVAVNASWMLLQKNASEQYCAYMAHIVRVHFMTPIVFCSDMEFRGNDFVAWVELPVGRSVCTEPEYHGAGVPWRGVPCAATGPVSCCDDIEALMERALDMCRQDGHDPRICDAILKSFKFCRISSLAARYVANVGTSVNVKSVLASFCERLLPMASAEMIDVIDARLICHFYNGGALPVIVNESVPETSNMVRAGESRPFLDAYHYHSMTRLAVSNADKNKVVKAGLEARPFRPSEKKAKEIGKKKDLQAKHLSQKQLAEVQARERTLQAKGAQRRKDRAATGLSKMRLRMADSMGLQREEVTVERALTKKEASDRKKALARKAAAAGEQTKDDARGDLRTWDAWKKLRSEFTAADAMDFLADICPAAQKTILAELIRDKPDASYAAFLRLLLMSGKNSEAVALAKELGYNQLAKCLTLGDDTVDMKWCKTQLCELSAELPRSPGMPDSRVRFQPDPWQVDLLNAVDAKESCVVVAATSAGKTFVQYYAMRKVLKESDDALCVYVCPTKALCHQVLAGVDARFQKHYAEPTSVVAGMFTKDQRKDIDRCQILVTVPECLDILLLQPTAEGQKWVQRLKWVIFDEVHCINEYERGPVWERILHVLSDRVPFLALSATVGEPQRFCSWLQSSRPRQKVNLIVHNERYNDLRVGVACSESGSIAVRDLHPCCFVTASMLCGEHAAFPQMVSLEPRDAWTLFGEMQKFAGGESALSLEGLTPAEFFRGTVVISRGKAKEWAERLKEKLLEWAKTNPSAVETVLTPFQAKLKPRDVLMPEKLADVDEAVYSVVTQLLRDGPVLAFCFRRPQVVRMVRVCVQKLEQEHKDWLKEEQKKPKPKAVVIEIRGNTEEERERSREEELNKVQAAEETFPRSTTFRKFGLGDGKGAAFRDEVIGEVMGKLGWDDSHVLIRGLHRGVGCHHAGLPHKYRSAVEVLFRTKDVTVLFSTTTLAQGIQAPARSVVLVQDSPFLDATSMRQMIGRAGRRGFDKIGRAVFVGVRYERVRSLLTSSVPTLRGSFPLTPSLVLRLELARPVVTGWQAESFVKQSMLCAARGGDDSILEHYSSFCKRLLQGLEMLDSDFNGIGFSGLCSHLAWICPRNLLFTFFLLNNLIDGKAASNDLELLRWLSCIFMPQPVRPDLLAKRKQCRVVDEVPQGVRNGVAKFNAFVRQRYCAYSVGISAEHTCCLPLSLVQVGSTASEAVRCSVSLFARTSGHSSATVNTIDELTYCMRPELVADHSSIPLVPELGATYNCFLSDFYRAESPSVDVIATENGLKASWDLINSFSSILQVIATSLTLMHREETETLRGLNVFNLPPIRQDESTTLLNTLWRLSNGFRDRVAKVKL